MEWLNPWEAGVQPWAHLSTQPLLLFVLKCAATFPASPFVLSIIQKNPKACTWCPYLIHFMLASTPLFWNTRGRNPEPAQVVMLLLMPRPASWGGDSWGCVWAESLHSHMHVNLNPKLVLVFCKSKGFYHLQLFFFFFFFTVRSH